MATTVPSSDGTIPFDNILNFRDVAQFINNHTGQRILNPGLLYRSARPNAATPSDRQRLTETLKIATILDLRTPTEHLEARAKHKPQPTPTSPALSPPDPTNSLHIPAIKYEEVNLNGNAYTSALLAHLTWSQTAQLYALYALGYRKDAIAVLATNVMAPRGLAGLAIDTLTHSKSEIANIFNSILVNPDGQTYPILMHCTQGKDRTGLIILLLLLLCGVDAAAIEADYMASQPGLAAERAEKVAEVKGIGLPEAFADCEVGWVGRVVEWIRGEGGVEAYLECAGVGRDVLGRVREVLVVEKG